MNLINKDELENIVDDLIGVDESTKEILYERLLYSGNLISQPVDNIFMNEERDSIIMMKANERLKDISKYLYKYDNELSNNSSNGRLSLSKDINEYLLGMENGNTIENLGDSVPLEDEYGIIISEIHIVRMRHLIKEIANKVSRIKSMFYLPMAQNSLIGELFNTDASRVQEIKMFMNTLTLKEKATMNTMITSLISKETIASLIIIHNRNNLFDLMTVEYNNKARYGYILVGGEVYYAYEQLNEDYSELRRQHEEESDDDDEIDEFDDDDIWPDIDDLTTVIENESLPVGIPAPAIEEESDDPAQHAPRPRGLMDHIATDELVFRYRPFTGNDIVGDAIAIDEASERLDEQVMASRGRTFAILEEERRRRADIIAENILERFNNNNEQYPW